MRPLIRCKKFGQIIKTHEVIATFAQSHTWPKEFLRQKLTKVDWPHLTQFWPDHRQPSTKRCPSFRPTMSCCRVLVWVDNAIVIYKQSKISFEACFPIGLAPKEKVKNSTFNLMCLTQFWSLFRDFSLFGQHLVMSFQINYVCAV